jgi:hypothetical protein
MENMITLMTEKRLEDFTEEELNGLVPIAVGLIVADIRQMREKVEGMIYKTDLFLKDFYAERERYKSSEHYR